MKIFAAVIVLVACGGSPPPPVSSPTATPTEVATEVAIVPANPSPIVDKGTIRSRFRDCGKGYIGQVLDAPGVTCAEVCSTYGYSRCRGRADQANYDICKSHGRDVVGSCDEVWQSGWTSQCDCTNTPVSASR